ncbi:MAG: GIY-YIG nuclease family protein [Comamonadaceae bacterium]|uniref:GIY-YIG nuclease family protein n=1 Tax=Candidatus Skiveiella danica TaxID=3386177 RepID=UPI003909B1CF|nr:GIY-YIG nuclease family protein [Comamonadaceae bacterium]
MPLYKLTSPSGKSYIGITRGALQVRLNHHRFDSERGSLGKLHKAIRKYGFENFKVDVLNASNDPDELCELEIAAMNANTVSGKGPTT